MIKSHRGKDFNHDEEEIRMEYKELQAWRLEKEKGNCSLQEEIKELRKEVKKLREIADLAAEPERRRQRQAAFNQGWDWANV